MEFYICKHCKNIVAFLKKSGVKTVCCGEEMSLLKANSTEAATEKHIPVVTRDCCKVEVVVGDVIHPMTEEHYIEFVVLETSKGFQTKYLKPGEEPKCLFKVDHNEEVLRCYAYCNLHSLWVKEL